MIRPNSIDHTCLLVTSLLRSKTYYERVFNVTCTPRQDNPKTLMVESPNIHFFISEVQGILTDFLSKQHLSFEVDNLDYVISALEELGISGYETGKFEMFQHRNYKWCEWRDPDGIRIECVERTS
jgi:catechol 2,3-dioxygenase-like lactoylglutathione lyase family enzyme